MGSPLSPVLACMVMEMIEQNAIETFFKPPCIWVRYVDDVYSIVETNQIALFHDHLSKDENLFQFIFHFGNQLIFRKQRCFPLKIN